MVALGLFAASAVPAQAVSPARAKLARSDGTPGLQHADKLHRADPRRQLTIGVSLALRNEAQLEAFIAQVSDRKSPSYGHYLTPAQFAASYGPTQPQVQSVVDHLRASGLTVGSVSSNRTIVEATGTVSAVEAAFGVTISDWHDRDQNRDFFGNDAEPTLPAAIASYVVGAAGLNNHYPLHRLGPAPKVGGGPAGGYTPNELKKAYDVTPLASAGYNGSGQRLGLFELDGFRQSNVTAYDNQYGLGSPAPPTTVLISGGPGRLGAGEIEVELDIEVMHAIAPASPITVWEGPNSDPGVNATYNAIVTSNTTKSNSTSWGICEPNTTQSEMTTLDNIFKQAASQGQSFFAASGDSGAYDCGDSRLTVDSPANDPYMTSTGGTKLALNADGSYQSESAWSNPNTFPASGGGGGLSGYFARPSWQTGPGVANTYSNGKRQVPDVSLDADPQTGYSVYVTYNGSTGWNVVGGTSAAAPAWAAFTGVYNQYAVAYSKPNLGYVNPTLYSTGSYAQAYSPYHDITTGDNLYYPTTANWDYPTGWGSFDAYNLARDLAGTLALTSVQASNINSTSAVVTWLTDHGATSQVDFGTTTAYGIRVNDTTNATNHSMTLTGLTNNTTYHFRARSTDRYGNSGSSSDASFTTSANLVSNSGFEVGAASWNLAGQASIDPNPADAHTGNNSLQLVATGPWQGSFQWVPVIAGQPYSFTAWGRSAGTGGVFTLISYDATGNVVGDVGLSFPGGSNWTAAAMTYAAPAGATKVAIILWSAVAGTFWFDDLSLSPTSNSVTNGGFEFGTAAWNLASQASIDPNPADAHTGNNSLQLVATGPWQGSFQWVPVIAGQPYSFNAWGRSASTGGVFTLISYDAGDNVVGDVGLSFPGGGNWTPVAMTYAAPAGATKVAIILWSSAAGSSWFDDITLQSK